MKLIFNNFSNWRIFVFMIQIGLWTHMQIINKPTYQLEILQTF